MRTPRGQFSRYLGIRTQFLCETAIGQGPLSDVTKAVLLVMVPMELSMSRTHFLARKHHCSHLCHI